MGRDSIPSTLSSGGGPNRRHGCIAVDLLAMVRTWVAGDDLDVLATRFLSEVEDDDYRSEQLSESLPAGIRTSHPVDSVDHRRLGKRSAVRGQCWCTPQRGAVGPYSFRCSDGRCPGDDARRGSISTTGREGRHFLSGICGDRSDSGLAGTAGPPLVAGAVRARVTHRVGRPAHLRASNGSASGGRGAGRRGRVCAIRSILPSTVLTKNRFRSLWPRWGQSRGRSW